MTELALVVIYLLMSQKHESPVEALTRQRRLLKIEYEAEKAAFQEITDRIGLARLIERGNAKWPLKIGQCHYNSLNRKVVEVEYTPEADGDADQESQFEYGKSVVLFTVDGDAASRPRRLLAGRIWIADGSRLVIAVEDSADTSLLASARNVGVMLSFDETTFRVMFEAIDRTIAAKGRLGELRDLIYTRSQLKENSAPDIGMHYLNEVQQRAVNKVLRARDVAVVHGPPGTGKTTTLVEAIHETLRRESQVMVCAQSNMAVDWICEKLTERGIAVIRLGNPSRVNDAMLASTYERRFEAHPDYPTLWSIRRDIRRIQSSREHGERRHQKIDRLRSRAIELELRIKADIFASARVIASTLVGSASPVLEGMRFNTLFVDEAAQALEAATLIALRRADRLVLAGDHCQLPPMVRSVEAAAGGLSRSMMEVVVENHPEAVTLLTMQYRMNADIMRFSSEWFYGGSMTAAREVAFRGILDYDVAIEWIDTATLPSPSDDDDDNVVSDTEAFAEQIAGESHGRINRDEAELTLRLLEEYFLRIGTTRIREEQLDVGIISPYRAQTRLLRRMLSRSRFFKPFRSRISVNTVDGFQGQERDIIMISLVRSNSGGNIGFLRDLRRMNVAMTRARMKLIIVGNAPTLGATPFYRRLQSYIASLHRSD